MSDNAATAAYKALWRDKRTTDTVMRLNAQTVRELAEVAVEAARPIIAAQALREAADDYGCGAKGCPDSLRLRADDRYGTDNPADVPWGRIAQDGTGDDR